LNLIDTFKYQTLPAKCKLASLQLAGGPPCISNGLWDIQWLLWHYGLHELDATSKQRSRSFILLPIDFSYAISYRLYSNFCSRTHCL